MKNITRLLLVLLTVIAVNTACTNEYKDMKSGEIRLKENDYRNDDLVQDIVIGSAEGEERIMTALELRTLWHSVVISAEKRLENLSDTEKNTYASPVEVEDAFFMQMSQSMALLETQYPGQYQAIVDELLRADVHVYAYYMWCVQTEEYVEMKFRATPTAEETTPPAEDTEETSGTE